MAANAVTMKKQFLALCILVLTATATEAQTLRAGVNFSNISITDDGDVNENRTLTGFQVGFTANMRLIPFIFFQPGIIFTGKGAKTESGESTGDTYYKATTNPYYIEIPANFVLKTPGHIKLFVGAGPYLAVGIGGKNKVEGKFLGTSFTNETNIKWSDDDPSTLDYEEGAGFGIMKRFDYGLNATAGIELPNSVIAIHYGHGLAKLQSGSDSNDNDNNKHRVLSLTLGIKL